MPDRDADQGRDRRCRRSRPQRHPGPVDDAREHVLAELVDAEGVRRAGPSGEPKASVRFRFWTLGPGTPRIFMTSGARIASAISTRIMIPRRPPPLCPDETAARTAVAATARRRPRRRRGARCPPTRRASGSMPLTLTLTDLLSDGMDGRLSNDDDICLNHRIYSFDGVSAPPSDARWASICLRRQPLSHGYPVRPRIPPRPGGRALPAGRR